MKRIWEYVLVFFIVMIGTGGYTVLSFNSSLTSTITTDTTISTDADPVFDGTLSRIMQTRDASANYNLNIETESGTINANGDILVKVTDDGFNFDFNLNTKLNGQDINVNIVYKNNIIYINANEVKVKFEQNSIQSFKDILTVLLPIISNLELPLDASLFENLDLTSLTTMLQINSNEIENGYRLHLALDNYVNILIETDKTYAPKLIQLEQIGVENASVNFVANTDFETEIDEISVSDELENSLDVSESSKLVKLILSRITQPSFNVDLKVNYNNNINILGNVQFDLSNKQAYVNLNVLNKNLQIYFVDNIFYASLMGINVKADTEQLYKLNELVLKMFNFDLTNLLNGFNTIDFENLNFIDEISETNNGVKVLVNGYEILFIENNQKLSEIKLLNKEFTFEAKIVDEKFEIETPTKFYNNIDDIVNFVQKFSTFTQNNQFKVDANIVVDNTTFNVNVFVDYNKGYKLETFIAGSKLVAVVIDNKIQISWLGINVETTFDELEQTINLISQKFNLNNLPKVNEIISNVESNLNHYKQKDIYDIIDYINNNNLQEFSLFEILSNSAKVEISGIKLLLNISDNSINIYGSVFENIVELGLKLEKVEIEPIEQCLNLQTLVENVSDIINSYSSLKFEANVEIMFNNINLNINMLVDLKNKQIQLSTLIADNILTITYKEENIYIEYQSIKLMASVKDFDVLVNMLQKFVNEQEIQNLLNVVLDVENKLNSIFEQTYEIFDIINFDITNIINRVEVDEQNINIEFKNKLLLKISNSSKTIQTNFNNQNIDITCTIEPNQDFEIRLEENDFSNIVYAENIIDDILNIVNNKQISGKLNTVIGNENIVANFALDFTNSIKLQITTTLYEKQLMITYIDTNIFVTFDGINIELDVNNISSLSSYIKEAFGFDIDLPEIPNFEFNLSSISLLEKLLISKNILEISAFGANVNISFDESINEINVNYNGLSFKIYDITCVSQIIKPEQNFVKLDKLIDIIQSVNEQLKIKQYGFDVTISNYTFNIMLDLLNGRITAKTNLQNNNLELTLIEQTLYITINNNLKFKVNIFDKEKLLTILNNFIDFDVEQVSKLIDEYLPYLTDFENQFNKVLGELNVDSFDITNIQQILNFESISLTENSVDFDGFGVNFNIVLQNNKISNIKFGYNNINAELLLCDFVEIVNPETFENYYIDVIDFENIATWLKEIINVKKVSATAEIKISNQTIPVNMYADFSSNNLSFKIIATLLGQTVEITLYNNKVFVVVDELKIWFGIDEINEITNWIEKTFGVDLNLNNVNDVILSDYNLNSIQSLEKVDENLVISLVQNLLISISLNNVGNIEVVYDNLILNLTNIKVDKDLVIEPLNENISGFVSYKVLLNIIENAYNKFTTTKSLGANIIITSDNKPYEVNFALDFSDGLKISIDTVLETEQIVKLNGQDVNAVYNIHIVYEQIKGAEDQTIYIKVNDFMMKIALSSINKIVDLVKTFVNIDLSEILKFINIETGDLNQDEIQNMLPENGSQNVLFLELIKNISLSESGVLSITASGGQQIVLTNGFNDIEKLIVKNVEAMGLNINLESDFTKQYIIEDFSDEEKNSCLDLSTLGDLALIAKQTVDNCEQWMLQGNVTLKASIFELADMGVNVNIIKTADNNIVITALLTNLPVGALYMDNSSSGISKNRQVYLYIKDGNLYVYRTIDKLSGFSFKTRIEASGYVSLAELTSSKEKMMDCLQMIIGWNNMIKNAINEGMANPTPPDYNTYEKWINNYSYDETSKTYKLSLNGAYVVNDENINNITLNILTNGVSITGVTGSMTMLSDDMIKLTISSLNLVNTFTGSVVKVDDGCIGNKTQNENTQDAMIKHTNNLLNGVIQSKLNYPLKKHY